ncbi:ABC transporter ATP-binding protein [Bordetella genomosp. 12]|uniref:ABC transporter ATP-binding protein n=1 Tax=Bordetella genomosp. 12 TaxID=463035 RepID=A0A261VE28_9BORD|nr:ABC transporter ATP-binding protein [Bordetella genomosp. 12]OZI72265.1 ABC transporter ATP-binding protein [Bordetella genomosp. 12]
MVQVQSVMAGYTREIDILCGMSLHVGLAEIVTLLGPNGCGKSTLLKTIAGYLTPHTGSILINGEDVTHMHVRDKVKSRGLGYVPQTDNVFNALSVMDNLLIGGYYLPKAVCRQRLDGLCERYPSLGRKLHAPAASLSGGERQILALARALMPEPRLLLLDEPSAGLSPKMLQEVFEAIQRIREIEGVTILMVEQNAVEALHISDRAYVLSMGTVALTGAASQLLQDARMRELYLGGRASD